MFAYCNNNPIMFKDPNGSEPVETIDTDGDGKPDCYVYEYTFEDILHLNYSPCCADIPISGSGHIYIFQNTDIDSLEKAEKLLPCFVAGHDFVVGDFTRTSSGDKVDNPNIKVRNSFKVYAEAQMMAIADVLLEYGKEYAPDWKRTKDSLVTEWIHHNGYASFSERAKHVDFDNAEEGKGGWYFWGKACIAALNSFAESPLGRLLTSRR